MALAGPEVILLRLSFGGQIEHSAGAEGIGPSVVLLESTGLPLTDAP